jgi:hypothetical protein
MTIGLFDFYGIIIGKDWTPSHLSSHQMVLSPAKTQTKRKSRKTTTVSLLSDSVSITLCYIQRIYI